MVADLSRWTIIDASEFRNVKLNGRESFHRVFPLHARRVLPLEGLRELLRFSAFTAMAAVLRPAKLLVLPDSSVQDTPVQFFARLGDSDILVGFKERILRSFMEPWPLRALRGFTSIRLSCGKAFTSASLGD